MQKFSLRTIVLLIAAGVAVAQGQTGPAGEDSPASLRIAWSASDDLHVSGTVSSTAHEAILRDTARRFFGVDSLDLSNLELTYPPVTPPEWVLITDLVLRAIAETYSATAIVTPGRVDIRGVADQNAELEMAIARVQRALPAGTTLDRDIVTLADSVPFSTLCRRRLLARTRDNRIEFYHSGAELRSGAFATLDAIAEILSNCTDMRVRVTGHTDASGSEIANLNLSQARADAVVDYLVGRGVPAMRLEAVGAGSAEPVSAALDAASRRRNRRVEFRMLP